MINATATQLAAGILLGRAQASAGFALALGIMAEFKNALGAGPFASAALPARANVSLGTVGADGAISTAPRAQWTASLTGTHTGRIDLGDGYRLEIDERNSEMTVFNGNTGERTRVWGDPHVEIDGRQAYDFWGTTTFTLENGTKITINTEQYAGNPNMYVASQLVITKGSNAIVVDGISQNRLGDLSVTQSNNGYAIDGAHRDGFVLHENATGAGWRSEHTGQVATQADLDATRIGAEYGPGSQAPSLAEAGGALSLFLLAGNMGALFGLFAGFGFGANANTSSPERVRPADRFELSAQARLLAALA